VQHFQASEIADLPPKLRALFEDNKVPPAGFWLHLQLAACVAKGAITQLAVLHIADMRLLILHAHACNGTATFPRYVSDSNSVALLQVLKEQIRRYKQRAQDAERQAEKQEQKVQSLSDSVRKLKAQLAEGAGSPEAAAAEQQLRQQAEATTKALEVGVSIVCASVIRYYLLQRVKCAKACKSAMQRPPPEGRDA
jgi:TolA-binding protein